MQPHILVVTDTDDAHADVVCDRLSCLGLGYTRLNVDELIELSGVWTIGSNSACSWLPLSVSTVWYRVRASVPQIPSTVQQSFTELERSGLLQSLLVSLPECRWINSLTSIQMARPKLPQLLRAKECGLRIPDTIVSNNEKLLKEFCERHNGALIAKPLQVQVIEVSGEDSYVFGTRRVDYTQLSELTAGPPSIVQEQLPNAIEIRVIAFGESMHAFRQTTQATHDDIKQASLDEIQHETFELPTSVQASIKQLMLSYGLEFAACDFILLPDGEMVFLELNPNGQWLWLQYMTGHDLLNPFISFLAPSAQTPRPR